jgi:ADP-ribosylglycohydrolase
MSITNLSRPTALAEEVISFESRVHGCWLGKSIGGTLGLPAEGKMERLNYSFYDPVPQMAPPNDDLELQLVWLHVVENAGSTLTRAEFAEAWIKHIHYMWDEYGRTRWNLRRGVRLEDVGIFENHFQSGMGSPIRSEIWACLFAGHPDSAAYYAALDASLDHGSEGIAGEVLFAVLQSEVAVGRGIAEAIATAMDYIPSTSETADAVNFILQNHQAGFDEWSCWQNLIHRHGNENFTHAPLNVAITIWALLYGSGDFETSILLAVNGGYDTDCTAATVGATLGLALGAKMIPDRWIKPIGEHLYVGPGILGISAPKTLGELTSRVISLVGKLENKSWDERIWEVSPIVTNLENLPGTITIQPFGTKERIPWSNGELPNEVKQAGGGSWTWNLASDDPREIICLAREGARLFINGEPLIQCAIGTPYVPATHRSASGSRVRVRPGHGSHELRVELDSRNPNQDASVILAYEDLHICPWTSVELPNRALLPLT